MARYFSKASILTSCVLLLIGVYSLYRSVDIVDSTAVHPTQSQVLKMNAIHTEEPFADALKRFANRDGWIVIAVFDKYFLDMAFNLHETSFEPHNINNYIFVAYGEHACDRMIAAGVHCFVYQNKTQSAGPSSYFSPDFRIKSHWRNDVIIDAILANYTVLYTDVDVVFLQNPLPELKVKADGADIAIQWDFIEYNSGFVVVNPTRGAIKLYTAISRYSAAKFRQQRVMNLVMRRMHLRIVRLLPPHYPCGIDYFEKMCKFVARPAKEICSGANCPVMVHNNWIAGKAAKLYRFREHAMWMHDEDGIYYGNASNRYITYNKPRTICRNHNSTESSVDDQLSALKTALAIGKILGRIVILPRFICGSRCAECHLNSLINVNTFDTVFNGQYRESSFLFHPKVPESTRTSMSTILAIGNHAYHAGGSKVVVPASKIADEFGHKHEQVLQFSTFHGHEVKFTEPQIDFDRALHAAFRRGRYRQT